MTADEIISFLKNNNFVKMVLTRPTGESRTIYCTLKTSVPRTVDCTLERQVVDGPNGTKTRIPVYNLQGKFWDKISAENLVSMDAVTEVPPL